MIKVSVRLAPGFSGPPESRRFEMELPDGADVARLADEIARRFPEVKADIFAPDGGIESSVGIVLGGRMLSRKDALSTRLSDGDDLSFITVLAGG